MSDYDVPMESIALVAFAQAIITLLKTNEAILASPKELNGDFVYLYKDFKSGILRMNKLPDDYKSLLFKDKAKTIKVPRAIGQIFWIDSGYLQ
jgi:hypothetical protein